MSKTYIIGFIANKGGVGKTTTVLNTAVKLSRLGYKVLVIDTDKQANLTRALLGSIPTFTLYDALMGSYHGLPKCAVNSRLTLVPASPQLFGIEGQLRDRAHNTGASQDLIRCIERLVDSEEDRYDFVLIDTSAIDNILTISALAYVEYIVMITRPEQFSLDAMYQLFLYLRKVKDKLNKKLKLLGVLITNYQRDSIGHVKGEACLREWLTTCVMETVIRHSRPLYTSLISNKDVFAHDPKSNGAQDYSQFVDEMIQRLNKNAKDKENR